jgi:hypothetical protein
MFQRHTELDRPGTSTGRRSAHALRFALALFAIAATVLSLLGSGAAQAAATLSSNLTRTPVGAVPQSAGPRMRPAVAKIHGGGALRPKQQVDPVRSRLMRTTALPASVDLSSYSVPVGDQGSIGSCVAWTIDYAMLGWYSKRYNRPGQPFHPMYTYSQIHADNSAGGGGSHATDALRVAYEQGNDTIAHYAHSLTDFVNLPTAAERANAANWKISGYQTLFANTSGSGAGSIGTDLIKSALANGKPVAIALPIRPGFDNMAKTSTTLDDDITGQSRGLHEVLATGYDQYGLWIQNSWGSGWGYYGYGRLSWRVVSNDVYQAHTISGFATLADTTPPAMAAVNDQFAPGTQSTATQAPVQLSWSATDTGGIGAYEVYVSTNNGQYVRDTAVSATATSIVRMLSYGSTYTYAVRAKDAAGNWSTYSYSAPLTPSLSDDKSFTVSSPWARYNLADTIGGTYIASSKSGSYVQKTFTGRGIGLVAPTFSTGGRATLYCDGTSYGLVDLYSSTTVGRKVMAWCRFPQGGQHTMKLVAEGTSGRPWLAMDAFVTLS